MIMMMILKWYYYKYGVSIDISKAEIWNAINVVSLQTVKW